MRNQQADQGVTAERALLGALIHHSGAMDRVTLDVSPSDMIVPMNQWLFNVLIKMHSTGISIDISSLIVYVGGLKDTPPAFHAYSAEIASEYGSVGNIDYYAGIIKSKALIRALVNTSANIPVIADDRSLSLDDKVAKIGKSVMDIVDRSMMKATEPAKIGDLLPRHIEAVELRCSGDPSIIPTGMDELDRVLCGGLRTQQFVIIGGRPSMGKTTLGLNIARGVAVGNGIPSGILSLEMNSIQIMDKFVSDIGSINYQSIRMGQLTDDDYERYAIALSRLQSAPLIIDDQSGLSMSDIERKARFMKRKYGIKLLMVDYIQLIRGEKGIISRAEQVEDISARLKLLAKKLDICVLGLAQLNRGADKENRPSLAQLRNSGALEQDCDVAIFPYREEKDNPDTDKKGMAEIIIGKQREGETGAAINSLFDGHYSRFREHPSMYRDQN